MTDVRHQAKVGGLLEVSLWVLSLGIGQGPVVPFPVLGSLPFHWLGQNKSQGSPVTGLPAPLNLRPDCGAGGGPTAPSNPSVLWMIPPQLTSMTLTHHDSQWIVLSAWTMVLTNSLPFKISRAQNRCHMMIRNNLLGHFITFIGGH